ncbi:MAG: hypothetical protein JWP92_1399 [Caulobacter sp.]|nr:hypothetical protein [Caulobacter sp.]
MSEKKAAPRDVETYLATVPAQAVGALRDLRALIRAAAPEAKEAISNGVPTYKLNGPLVSFSATPRHCAFYVMSPGPIAARKAELSAYDTAPSAIRFQPNQPLPAALVTAIVQDRLAENRAKR